MSLCNRPLAVCAEGHLQFVHTRMEFLRHLGPFGVCGEDHSEFVWKATWSLCGKPLEVVWKATWSLFGRPLGVRVKGYLEFV